MVDRRSLWVTLSCSAILLRKAQFENLFAKMRPLKKDTRLVKSLHQKKFRQEYGLFIVEGLKMVEEPMNPSFEPVALYSTDDESEPSHSLVCWLMTSSGGQRQPRSFQMFVLTYQLHQPL